MENSTGTLKRLDGGQTVEEVLADGAKLAHNWTECIVIGYEADGTVHMVRTRMSIMVQALLVKVIDNNVAHRLNNNLVDLPPEIKK